MCFKTCFKVLEDPEFEWMEITLVSNELDLDLDDFDIDICLDITFSINLRPTYLKERYHYNYVSR